MACFPWVQQLSAFPCDGMPSTWRGYNRDGQPNSADFLNTSQYMNVMRWAAMIMQRPATVRGMSVCAGEPKPWREDKGLPAAPKL